MRWYYWLLCIVSTFSLFAYFTLPSLFLFHPPTWIDPKCFVVCFLFSFLSFTASPKIEWNMREIESDVFSSWFCCHHQFGNMMKSIPISFGCSHFKCLLIQIKSSFIYCAHQDVPPVFFLCQSNALYFSLKILPFFTLISFERLIWSVTFFLNPTSIFCRLFTLRVFFLYYFHNSFGG